MLSDRDIQEAPRSGCAFQLARPRRLKAWHGSRIAYATVCSCAGFSEAAPAASESRLYSEIGASRPARAPETTPAKHLAISGFSRHTPSDRMTKSAGSNTCPLMNSNTFRYTAGRSGTIKSNMNADDPARFSCMIPMAGSYPSATASI